MSARAPLVPHRSISTSWWDFPWNIMVFFMFCISLVYPAPDPAAASGPLPSLNPTANPSGRTVHVVGLLGTTDLPDDWWMATDFLVWRELLSEVTHSTWLCGMDLSQPMGVVLGEPYANRLKFILRTAGITLATTLVSLLQEFFSALQDVVERANPEDVVIVVLCAHSEHTGAIRLGGGQLPALHLQKANVEKALRNIRVPQERIFLVSTACYSGTWRSPSWTLLAATEADQESDAMRTSGSKECRGGSFTHAVLAEMADEQGLEVPLCEERQDDCETIILADIQLDSLTPGNLHIAPKISESPRRLISDAYKFMEGLQDRIGGVYRSTAFVADPSSDSPSQFPSQLFQPTFLERFEIIGPSPPDIISQGEPDTPTSEMSESEFALSAPLTTDETASLAVLASAFHNARHPTTASNVPAVIACSKFISGEPLPHATQRLLLSRLQCYARACCRAAAIAEFLGWDTVEPVEKWRRQAGLTHLKQAEVAGAKILSAFLGDTADGAQVGDGQPLWRPRGPGEWLAQAWVEAGKPNVKDSDWEAALKYGNAKAI
ncbi:hypothetical protein C8R44DRAFT_84018 [Mycena epipterygia]|nr:hypothetical protein C8R44DRAFT_84018 [Mycena epipterygia]